MAMNFKRMADQAKRQVNKRGGTGALKEDLAELKDVAKQKGSLKDKAKAAGQALKEPGANEGGTPKVVSTSAPKADPAAAPPAAPEAPVTPPPTQP